MASLSGRFSFFPSWCEGEIKVCRLEAGETPKDPLTPLPLFNLFWNHDRQDLEVTCVQGKSDPAPAKIAQKGKYAVFQCSRKSCFKSHKKSAALLGRSHVSFPEGFEDHWDAFKGLDFYKGDISNDVKFSIKDRGYREPLFESDGLQYKDSGGTIQYGAHGMDHINVFSQEQLKDAINFNCPLLPLRSSPYDSLCPVKPGIYKADYGSHGVEIVQAGMNGEQPNLFECLKLTGDPNVPAGNVSIKVNLDRPVLLSLEEQESAGQIIEADDARSIDSYNELRQSNDGHPDLRQPFQIPRDCSERDKHAKKTCLARYTGLGRIAFRFFSSPSFCKLHFIKFDEDTFGILWLDLYSFDIFHREKQDFLACAL